MESKEEQIKSFEEQRQKMEPVYKNGFEKFARAVTDIENAFTLNDRTVRCIDEGTPGGIHSAGSGILMSEEAAVKAFKDAQADGITSHEGCGAAGIYAKENGLDPSQSDQYGIDFAKKLAGEMGIPYNGHIGAEEMNRPIRFHNALIAYYDGTGNFDYSKAKELPAGFTVSRKYLDPKDAAKEAKLSIDIALGGHGFGKDLIDGEKAKFILAILGNPREGLDSETLKKELEEIAKEYGERVEIHQYTHSQFE